MGQTEVGEGCSMRNKARNISPCLLHVSRRLKTECSYGTRSDSELLLIRSAAAQSICNGEAAYQLC